MVVKLLAKLTLSNSFLISSTSMKPGVVCMRIRAVSRTSGNVDAIIKATIAKLYKKQTVVNLLEIHALLPKEPNSSY